MCLYFYLDDHKFLVSKNKTLSAFLLCRLRDKVFIIGIDIFC